MTDAAIPRIGARLLFYNDSEIFGGHEMQTVALANAGARLGYAVTLLYYREEMAALADAAVKLRRLGPRGGAFSFVRSFDPRRIVALAREFAALRPDLVVVAQGNIEVGLLGIFASRRAGLRTVSYIPFGLTMSQMRARLGRVRDPMSRIFFRLPDAFITSSEHHARLLRLRTSTRVFVVPPTPPAWAGPRLERRPAHRAILGIAVVGRISFSHKNQDVLPRIARELVANGVPSHFHVIGDGRDRAALEQLIAMEGMQEHFTLWGWCARDEVQRIIREHADVWLIPSHYEGVPSVLLEAAQLGTPVLVSHTGCAGDFDIPADFLVDTDNYRDTAARLAAMHLSVDAAKCEALRSQILARCDPAVAEAALVAAIDGLLR